MLIQSKIGHIDSFPIKNRSIDWLELEWYETQKRVLRKRTHAGKEVALKFMKENPGLSQGDILFADDSNIIAVEVLPCDCIVIEPGNMLEMASVCYEIGNKHLPLFFENNCLLVPFERPLFRLLISQGYKAREEKRKLLYPLKTTVSPHAHNGESLFSKIMKLTTTDE